MVQDFENRLSKNYRHIRKWAKRLQIACFRVYDFDIPSFPFCVEKYADYVHISLYKTKKELSREELELLLNNLQDVVARVLEIPTHQIFFKTRARQLGSNQYEKLNNQSTGAWVDEFGAKLWVNFTDYLDTGLFLDHRTTRNWVREKSQGKKVLNLFSYTGAFSVQAARGGARLVDTIDMSNVYLEWAEKNMRANGFESKSQYRYFREDILAWLKKPISEIYDLIILDPPTFSNSKMMKGILDIQRDYVFLLQATLKRLNHQGILYFSNNFRGFKMDASRLPGVLIKDVSAQSIPEDFRNKKIHQCYMIQKV